MCLLVAAFQLFSDEPLIVGANRDEFLERPATAITVLDPGQPRIIGGRDELSGGTWLAVNEEGVFAGLTNQPLGEAKDPSRRSRGELPLALTRRESAAAAVEDFLPRYRPSDYNGSWILVGDRSSLFFIDFTGLAEPLAVPLPPGLYVLENRPLGVPSAKVDLARGVLGSPSDSDAATEAFRAVLTDHRLPEGDERPQAANCVHLEGYATRSSCLLRVPSDQNRLPQVWVAAGPPCATPFENAGGLWSADLAASQPRTRGL